ncbi:hypothetical protein ANO11243_056100 [Dothideomycetidae sp. 11243]|nr:hypothetical protein ANO11243_056100 [fungal sp. No.11243]
MSVGDVPTPAANRRGQVWDERGGGKECRRQTNTWKEDSRSIVDVIFEMAEAGDENPERLEWPDYPSDRYDIANVNQLVEQVA